MIDHACHEHCLQSGESAVDKALRAMEKRGEKEKSRREEERVPPLDGLQSQGSLGRCVSKDWGLHGHSFG
jgi:hypothetical protein